MTFYPIYDAFLWLVLYSFVGWAYESILVSVSQRRPVNRGFLNGPVCPIYGFGALGTITLLGDVTNPIALFLASAVLDTTLEYVTSWAMEKLFHARWWDYSKRPFNINGRVCLYGFIIFGAMCTLLMEVIHPFVLSVTMRIPVSWRIGLSIALGVVLAADLAVTLWGMASFHASMERMRDFASAKALEARSSVREMAGRARETVRESRPGAAVESAAESAAAAVGDWRRQVEEYSHGVLNFQHRRMLRSFPRLHSTDGDESDSLLQLLKDAFTRHH